MPSPRRSSTGRFRVSLTACWLGLGCLLGLSQDVHAQERTPVKVYPDSSHTADTLLRNAENHVRGGQFGAAIETYQRVIAQFGDKVVEVPAENPANDSHLFVDARFDCQRRIAALPPEGRAIYRSRVDPQAGRWYQQGLADRDRAALRRVVEEAYCSSWGDDALELLGDFAFQEGRFSEALAAYRRLVPAPGDLGPGLVHPDPSIDLAKVAAKALLTQAALGTQAPTRADLEGFSKRFPNAKGSLAGRDDAEYANTLADAIKEDRLIPASVADIRWPTFAGSPSRNRIASGTLDVGSLQWQVDLEPAVGPKSIIGRVNRFGGPRQAQFGTTVPTPPERLLAYHPIIVGEQVLFCDQKQVVAYDLNQRSPLSPGIPAPPVKAAWRQDGQGGFVSAANRQFPSIPRYTLTAFGDRIYARMGPPATIQFENDRMGRNGFNQPTTSTSVIVALDRLGEGKLLWRRTASEITLPKHRGDNANRSAVFEGSPVADANGVYVAITDRIEMTATYVVCLDPDTGNPRWVRYVCEANANIDRLGMLGTSEISHRLLSLEGSTIYFQTNLGAVAALDAETGGIKWIATYPWEGRGEANDQPQERDLNPAVISDGLVIVAPDDAPAIYAFNALTGRLVWKTKAFPGGFKLSHLLGVAKGNVVATGDRVMMFNVKTGDLTRIWPDNGQTPEGYGRGVLAGDKIYWPTKGEIHILDQATGLRTDPPIKLQETFGTSGGNLTVGDGYLIIAGENSLTVFCQNRRLIERYKAEIARAPDQAVNYYRLAQAAESAGLMDLALENLDRTLSKGRPSEMIDGLPLVEAARDHQYRLLFKQGFLAKESKAWAEAEKKFAASAEVARTPRDRLAARLERADAQLGRGDAVASVETLQDILADRQLRPVVVDVADGRRSVRADLLVVDRLGEILRQHGRAPYARFDREADELSRRGRADREPRLLDDLTRSYPLASAVPESLLTMGEILESQGQFAEATRAYRRALTLNLPEPLEIRGMLGLARAFESQKLWLPARDVYLQAKARFPDAKAPGDSKPVRLADYVVERLATKAFDRLGGDAVEPSVAMPLGRLYRRDWARPLRPLAAEGFPPSTDSGRIFLVEGTKLFPVNPGQEKPAWTFDLESEPVWVGYLSDRIIAASRSRIVALSLAKGTTEWRFEAGRSDAAMGEVNPFAKPDAVDALGNAVSTSLQDFRIVGGRVVCLQGNQSLLAIDGDTGQVDWTFTPAVGRINPRMMVGASRIVLQVRKPNAILVLDTATGRRRSEYPQGVEEDWTRDPVALDDDHVVIVADRRTVALFDLNRGVPVWHFRESDNQPKYGPPRIFVGPRHLLVLHDGKELISLDPANGSKRWYRTISSSDLSERPESIALGADRFFFVSGADENVAELTALSLDDGSPVWSRPLIGMRKACWALALTERHVVSYPNPSRMNNEDLSSWPIVVRRREGGGIAQRLTIPASSSDLTVKLAPKGALIATKSGLWSLIERSP